MLIRTALVVLSCLAACGLTAATAEDTTPITIVTPGGNVVEQMRKAWYEPAIEGLKVHVVDDVWHSYNDIVSHVQAGNVYWDIVYGAGSQCEDAGRRGAAEELDFSVISKDGLPPGQITKWSVPADEYTVILAWNKETYKGVQPSSWADFYDTKKFPGKRMMSGFPAPNLEIALLADGVKKENLYPLEVDRAFAKLRMLKPNIANYYSSGGAATQLVLDGEPDMLPIYENRLFVALKDGAKFGYTYNQGMLSYDCFMIPKGSKHKDLAMKIIARMTSAKINAGIAAEAGISPSNLKSVEFIPQDLAKKLAIYPDNYKKLVLVDNGWWIDMRPKLSRSYDEFKAK